MGAATPGVVDVTSQDCNSEQVRSARAADKLIGAVFVAEKRAKRDLARRFGRPVALKLHPETIGSQQRTGRHVRYRATWMLGYIIVADQMFEVYVEAQQRRGSTSTIYNCSTMVERTVQTRLFGVLNRTKVRSVRVYVNTAEELAEFLAAS